jgi:hypothetical protein
MSLYNCADDKVPSFWTLFNFYQNQIQTNLLTDLDDKMPTRPDDFQVLPAYGKKTYEVRLICLYPKARYW